MPIKVIVLYIRYNFNGVVISNIVLSVHLAFDYKFLLLLLLLLLINWAFINYLNMCFQ